MKFTKQNLPEVRADIAAALKQVGDKHGIALSIGHVSYTEDTFSTKLSAVSSNVTDNDGDSENVKWKSNFLRTAFKYGLKPSDLDKQVTIGCITYTIVGARPKAQKPIVLQRPDGSFVAFASAPVVSCLNK